MIKHGVALVRLSNAPNGCAGGPHQRNLDEFYVVVAEGEIRPPRFMSYAAAFRYLEKLQEEARADVA